MPLPRIMYILTNERYIGDCKYQKKYREKTVPFKQHRNCGQEDMFYAKGTHEPLLEREVFENVQALLKKRLQRFGKPNDHITYPLTSRIRCSECGSSYRRKIRGGVIKWACALHTHDSHACPSSYYTEARIYDSLVSMINKLRFDEADILGQVISKLEEASLAYKRNNRAASQLSQSIAEINAKILMLDQLRSKGYLDPDIHQAQVIDLRNQLAKAKAARISSFETKIIETLKSVKRLKSKIDEIEAPLETFDETNLLDIIEEIQINKLGEMTVTVLGGLQFKEQL